MKATKLQKLFSRRSDGGLQSWEMEVEGSKYRVTSGMVGGKTHTNEWTEAKPKNVGRANATTAEEQALLEAQATWNKKYREGYRPTEAEFKTVGIFEPMLAKQFEDYKDKLKYPVYSQPKLDGIRCIADPRGTWTRTGRKHTTLGHIEAALAKVFEKHPDLVLDGEAYSDKHNKNFPRICSLVKRENPTAAELLECAQNISYHVYDCKFMEEPDKPFSERSAFIRRELAGNDSVVIVPTEKIDSPEMLNKYYESYITSGQEGQIVRINDKYENKRSKFLLKRKEFDDAEFTILGMEEGTGNRAGTCGAMMFETPKGGMLPSNGTMVESLGKPFRSNVKGTWEFTEDLWKNRKKYMGKTATVRYFGLSPEDRIPRFPYVIAIRDGE